MKKYFILLLLILTTSVALAAWDTDGIIVVGDDNVTLSKNVYADFVKPNDNTTYSAVTMNILGTRIYGGASDSTVIYYKNCTSGGTKKCSSDETEPTLSNKNANDFSTGWTELGE